MAQKGNKNAEKWTAEIVTEFFKSVEDKRFATYVFGEAISLTIEEFIKDGKIKTNEKVWSGLNSYLQQKFKDNSIVFNTIKKAEQSFESKLLNDAFNGDIKNAAIVIFYLKNKHGYKDKTETDITTNNESLNPVWKILPDDYKPPSK